jgi:prepilin-type N-terminal cleavage/methylation domain-containing protein/prepilin-type processing-associated H-X9-DG protein
MRTKRAAFTLIELMTVVAIIGLLIAIIVPSLGQAKTETRRVTCRSNLHAVGVALRMYLNENNDVLPVAALLPSAKLNDDPRIADVLAPYLSNPLALKCSADQVKNYYTSEGSSYEYHSMLGGRKLNQIPQTQTLGEGKIFLMHDYEPFHGPPGEVGSSSYLFADGHAGNLE